LATNIAYFEEILVIGTLVQLFNFKFKSEDFKLQTLERFNSSPGELVLSFRRGLH